MFHVERSEQAEIEIPHEAVEKLQAYKAMVLQWTKKINLVSRSDHIEFWQRHIVDCLQLVAFIPQTAKELIDLGSGAGLPGLVVAIATNINVTLIEADQRKAAFLRMAIISLGLSATVESCRIEISRIPPSPLIIARALAPLPRLLELAVPKLLPHGVCLFMKGETAERELTLARNQWQMKVERFASRTSSTATIFRLSEISRAPPRFSQPP